MSKTVTDEEIVEAYNELVKEGKINKVELGLADDVRQLHANMIAGKSFLKNLQNKVIDEIRDYKSEIVRRKQDAVDGDKKLQKLKNTIKELGVDLPGDIKKIETDFDKTISDFQKQQTNAQKALNSI